MFTADRSLGSARWPVVRLVPGSKTEIVLLSPSFFEITTHWYKCTVVCPGEDCDLCELLPSRGLFYVACFCASRLSILELGSQSASHFEQHCKLLHRGMIAGQVVELHRRTAKSPVHSEVVRFQENAASVTTLTLAARVMALYKFPPPNPAENLERYEQRLREAAKLRNRRLAAQLIDAPQKR